MQRSLSSGAAMEPDLVTAGMDRDIALIGKMGSGKDTVAALLAAHAGYERLAFADPVRTTALGIDPIVLEADEAGYGEAYMTLREAVAAYGWDDAKRRIPEVRRILQNTGTALREHDKNFWLRMLLQEWGAALGPVVVTDCRFANEADALAVRGFTLIRVVRPGVAGDAHVSETELDDYPVDHVLDNSGSMEDLREKVRALYHSIRA